MRQSYDQEIEGLRAELLRMGDHAFDIAEWVIYLVTGQRLRKK
jgi:phosphate uptake regulator